MNQRYIVVEPFCGMAGLSFYLMGGKPPISWMGSKVGYSETLAAILGLSRTNVAGFVWGDVGPNVAALATLAGATGATAEDVANWVWVTGRSFNTKGAQAGFLPSHSANGVEVWNAHPPEYYADSVESLPLPNKTAVANLIRSWKDEEPRALWERLKAKGWPSLLLPDGCRGRWLGPASVEDVAGWLHSNALSMVKDGTAGSYSRVNGEGNLWISKAGKEEHWQPTTVESTAWKVAAMSTFPLIACWQGRAEDLVLPQRLDGWIVYMDGPYHGDGSRKITGYKHGGCSRESQLDLARGYHARGATVAVSESVRLDRELGEGWHAVQIDHARRGQKRSFSVQQDEWLTLNRPPQYYPPKQSGFAMELQEVPREVVAVEAPRPVVVEAAKEQLSLWGRK